MTEPFDLGPAKLRSILGHFATGLTVITAATNDGRAGRFAVNILPAEHQHLAAQVARSGTDKFAGVEHSASPLGSPILEQALAWVDGELHQEYDGGDHTIVVGAVRALSARPDAEPLLFFKGEYVGVRSRAGALAGVA